MQLSSSRKSTSYAIHCVAVALALGYFCLAIWSKQPGGVTLFPFLGLMGSMSAILFGFYGVTKNVSFEMSFGFVLGWAVIYRLIALVGAPVMEDDQYRFMLDGCVFLEYGNPYGVSPLSLFAGNNLSRECADTLNWVNNPHLATIYGPVLEVLFAISSWVSPANVSVLQILMASFDIGVIVILSLYTSPRNVMLYAWCPLVLKEFAFTAHPDVVSVFLLLWAFYLGRTRRPLLAAAALACACAAKVFALVLAPFLLLLLPPRAWIVFVITVAVWYLPFLLIGDGGTSILSIFASSWLFNPTVFLGLTTLFNDTSARLIALALFTALWGTYLLIWWPTRTLNGLPRGDILFAVFLLLSPVFNAWYGIWILAFAVIRPSMWAWSFSIALLLSYVTGINWLESGLHAYEMADWAVWLEMGILGIAVLIYGVRHLSQRNKIKVSL
ncbi:MAG: alpha-1,6-mannosyltransferase [Saprospiraceae bacterium]|jgi:alpha-1,6-mannosyltransferase